jgi:hypothetical protein
MGELPLRARSWAMRQSRVGLELEAGSERNGPVVIVSGRRR